MHLRLHFCLISICTLLNFASVGQDFRVIDPVICEAEHVDAFSEIRNNQLNSRARITTSDISVTYVDFPEAAQNAFEQAVQLWESIIVSPQKIKIRATWASLAGTTLAQSGATKIYRNFPSAPYRDVWYPAALAEAISGQNLNENEDEINISMNQNINWSYNLDGRAVQGRFDLVTVVLHEIAHGLGFNASFGLTDDASQGKWGQNLLPYIYDLFVQNSQFEVIKDTKIYGNPSVEIKQQLIGNDLFFSLGKNIYSGTLPRLSAVDPFRAGASISHLDEATFPQGNEHALMTPSVRSAEVIHTPGNLTLLILNQLGWGIRNLPTSENIITANEIPEISDVLTYPNPVSTRLSVFIPTHATDTYQLDVIDLTGRQIFSTIADAGSPTVSINVFSWKTGNYLLKIKVNNKISTKKIVVIR